MNTFDDFSPSAWQEEGVLWMAHVVVEKTKKRARRLAAATAFVSVAAAGVLSSLTCDYSPTATALAEAVLDARLYEAPPRPPSNDLVPKGYWQDLRSRAKGVERLVEAPGSDPEILM